MERETILKWLLECSEEGDGESCKDCPFTECEDCAGALMAAAAAELDVLEGYAYG